MRAFRVSSLLHFSVLIRTPKFMKYIKTSGGPDGMTEDNWREVELLAWKGQVVDIRRRPADSKDHDDPLIKVRWLEGHQALKQFQSVLYLQRPAIP